MVVLGVERWRCRLLGYKKRKRKKQKSRLWKGLIHSGEESTKSGVQNTKNVLISLLVRANIEAL